MLKDFTSYSSTNCIISLFFSKQKSKGCSLPTSQRSAGKSQGYGAEITAYKMTNWHYYIPQILLLLNQYMPESILQPRAINKESSPGFSSKFNVILSFSPFCIGYTYISQSYSHRSSRKEQHIIEAHDTTLPCSDSPFLPVHQVFIQLFSPHRN